MPLVITKMIVHLWRVPMVRQLAVIDMTECGVTEKLLVLQEVKPPDFKSEHWGYKIMMIDKFSV